MVETECVNIFRGTWSLLLTHPTCKNKGDRSADNTNAQLAVLFEIPFIPPIAALPFSLSSLPSNSGPSRSPCVQGGSGKSSQTSYTWGSTRRSTAWAVSRNLLGKGRSTKRQSRSSQYVSCPRISPWWSEEREQYLGVMLLAPSFPWATSQSKCGPTLTASCSFSRAAVVGSISAYVCRRKTKTKTRMERGN